jgi:hypothetical protein
MWPLIACPVSLSTVHSMRCSGKSVRNSSTSGRIASWPRSMMKRPPIFTICTHGRSRIRASAGDGMGAFRLARRADAFAHQVTEYRHAAVRSRRGYACCGCVSADIRVAGATSWINVPPNPSADITKLAAVYWPSNAILAVCVPSLAVRVPPVLLLLSA